MRLVSVNDICPSSYNPRKADPKRLDIIALSLRKLGFVMPLYADKNGEILSGHQRHYVATEMLGLDKVPVEYIPEDLDLEARKAVNIAFNRGTNDLKNGDTPASLTNALKKCDVFKLADNLEDVADYFPCMKIQLEPIKPFLKQNRGEWSNYSRNLTRILARSGVSMPIVATCDKKVINGIGRLQFAAEKKKECVAVVYISNEQAEFSFAMLNYLSMDFDIHNRYRDLLRYNSFRRARVTRNQLGRGFIFVVAPTTASKDFDVREPANKARWKRIHGNTILDFGAGHLTETQILRSIGCRVTAFEPYRLGPDNKINKAESIELAKSFLKDVADGVEYTSIFISSVLNSVPFLPDRKKIICICSALCSENTNLFSITMSTNISEWAQVCGKGLLSSKYAIAAKFKLDYEPGITIGEIGSNPKVQKYHTTDEVYHLFKEYFDVVQVKYSLQTNIGAICQKSKPINVNKLKEALEFEFDLPYPDGSRMNLVNEAKAAFSQRLGLQL